MGLFGGKRVKGISKHELTRERIQSKLNAVFTGSRSSRERKKAALNTALSVALDRDTNMGTHQKKGVIQREEFEMIVSGLEKGNVISSHDAEELRRIAEAPLND